MPVNRHVLLTGAGFTHNFGAPLARDIWQMLLAHPEIRNCGRLRQLLHNDLDFESVYHIVTQSEDYTDQEKTAIINAVREAYGRLDETIRDLDASVNHHRVRSLLNKFAGENDSKGFLFSTNQDLFIERHYPNDGLLNLPCLPGVPRHQDWFSMHFNRPLAQNDFQCVPMAEELTEERKAALLVGSNFFYIKLHGSQTWKRSNGEDAMVIGYAKDDQIEREPLLSWYFELLRWVLSQPERRLLVVGYGFRDAHINEVIADAMDHHQLRLHVVTPATQNELRDQIREQPHGATLWNGLAGYYRGTLADLFPPDQSDTHEYRRLRDAFFDGESY